jgi:hypothetical protein
MTQQQAPAIVVGGRPVTGPEATTALMHILSDATIEAKFTAEVLAIRLAAAEAKIAQIEANGTGDLDQTAEEEPVASPHEEGTQDEGPQEGA